MLPLTPRAWTRHVALGGQCLMPGVRCRTLPAPRSESPRGWVALFIASYRCAPSWRQREVQGGEVEGVGEEAWGEGARCVCVQ